jgi:alkyldihydroxyacetonephosphate synthase
VTPPRARKHWGWGYADEALTPEQTREAAAGIAPVLGFGDAEHVESPVPLEQVDLPAPRLGPPPPSLAGMAATDAHARATHAYGKSYRDTVRGFRGRFDHVPDLVVQPANEQEIEQVLAYADTVNAAVIPYGGGTSVVAGVEPIVPGRFDGTISLDLQGLNKVLEVDDVARSARIQAGTLGPDLEEQLAQSGMTLRHFPQSFQFSSLGGWVATRAGGHFATAYTHIDDLVESVRAITPQGEWQSRRLPGSGAGPSPDRLLIGSEGILGVITEAWVRIRPRPTERASVGVTFPSFQSGADAVRSIVQAELRPTNCRLLDPAEAQLTSGGDGVHALLVLGYESAGEPVQPWLDAALKHCGAHGGEYDAAAAKQGGGQRAGAVGAWRDAFLRAPYLRDTFVAMGVLSETFETSITWERFPAFHAAVTAATRQALDDHCGGGKLMCRFTHVYPNGPAPYYTLLAPARRGEELDQWAAVKTAASDALIAAGGTITHHHAVGRDHRPWYDRQRPDPFALALAGAKAAVDPAGRLNPGVLIDA